MTSDEGVDIVHKVLDKARRTNCGHRVGAFYLATTTLRLIKRGRLEVLAEVAHHREFSLLPHIIDATVSRHEEFLSIAAHTIVRAVSRDTVAGATWGWLVVSWAFVIRF
jgi:hypothetical protein